MESWGLRTCLRRGGGCSRPEQKALVWQLRSERSERSKRSERSERSTSCPCVPAWGSEGEAAALMWHCAR